ncbi:hypothetical protein R3I93_014573 [Phoxinus phoxinus]|uniref:Uncharacterized protein n=2 Tax=Phoxinus phoxinus TaxID=58324 RepID=A0AAN9CQP2_9TELE
MTCPSISGRKCENKSDFIGGRRTRCGVNRKIIMAESNGMTNAQLIQQLALLGWLKTDSVPCKDLLTAVTGMQVCRELLDRLSGQNQIDAFRRECILSIADFVKKNPRASQRELNAEVEKNVLVFASRVQAL